MRRAEEKIRSSESFETGHKWMVFVTYAVVSYVLSLRGSEGFLLDLKGLHQNWERNDGTFFIAALLGK